MSKRLQLCSRCRYPIRHGYPRGRQLFCSETCMRGDRPHRKAIAATVHGGAS